MHEQKALTVPPASPSSACRERARGWFRDPALWAWVAVCLLALLPLRSAIGAIGLM